MAEELVLEGVRLEMPASTPVMLLREVGERGRELSIYIGGPEASSIHYALEGIEPERPLTHDLFLATLEALGASLERVVITEVRDHTYFADLVLLIDERLVHVSARPSDGVALAVRCKASIWAESQVLDQAGREPIGRESEEGTEELMEGFRAFIDTIRPEDFEG